MASVMLEPVRVVDEAGIVTAGTHSQITMTAVQTGLDGSFAIPKSSLAPTT
jgi:anti-anti-sigma regulatory factor